MRPSAIRAPLRRLRLRARAATIVGGLCVALVAGSCTPSLMTASTPGALSGFASGAEGEIWLALPLNAWLGAQASVGEPETIIACIGPECPARLAAGVFRLTGEAARRAERDLRDPQALVARLGRGPDVEATGAAFSEGGSTGFTLSVASRTDPTRSIHGAALGRREGEALRFALVIGDDAGVVRAAAVQIAQSEALSARP